MIRQGLERKQTATGHTVDKSKQPDGGAHNCKARKFKLIFLKFAINHKITNNPWYGPPHFMAFSKLYRPLLILLQLKRPIHEFKSINGPALLRHSNSIRQ